MPAAFSTELPFLHALVRVRPEKPLAACLEQERSTEEEGTLIASSFGAAYSQALQVSW